MPSQTERQSTVPEVPKLDAFLGAAVDLLKHPSQDVLYEVRKLRGYRDALFEHFAPFRVGDHVRLTKDVSIGKDSGWRGYEAMMVAGATAEIVKVDWLVMHGEGRFVVDVMFDEEFSESSYGGVVKRFEREGDKRHRFCFHRPDREWEKVNFVERIYAA